MKRRQVLTAFGTLAIGTGTALGTGAFAATSSNSNSALSVVTASESAEIDIVPGYNVFNDSNIGSDVYIPNSGGSEPEYIQEDGTIAFDRLSLEDLPVAVVKDAGYGMASIEVAVEVGRPPNKVDFANLLGVKNEDKQDYEIGFTYKDGYTSVVTGNNAIDKSVANTAFQFLHGGTVVSPNPSNDSGDLPEHMFRVNSGRTDPVSLYVDADQNALISAYSDVYGKEYKGTGSFKQSAQDAQTSKLIDTVTAVANELTSRGE